MTVEQQIIFVLSTFTIGNLMMMGWMAYQMDRLEQRIWRLEE